ncbi:AI-2E family transporter [Archangium sp.]|uniref:AI-2E family transporter n=1 Tax=Archangium sp. TaxID=1872627 RepID=UPI002D6E1BC3|nr:AI-2E family transporter [Archangium sp.]HYO58250.1 AI-2E family transporter [Archangium sp.]
MLQPHELHVPAEQRRKRLYILAGLWLSVAAILVLFRSVLLPFASAALISYLVHPLVTRISRMQVRGWNIPRWVAILLIYALFFLVAYLFFITMVPQLYRELARISRDGVVFLNSLTPERIHVLADRAEEWLRANGIPVAISTPEELRTGVPTTGLSLNLEKTIQDAALHLTALAREHLGDIVTVSRNIITSVVAGVFMMFFMLMVAAFFSIDAHAIVRYFISLVPAEYAADAQLLLERIDRSLSGVVRGQVTICVVNGILTGIGLVLFGVKFAFLLATVATVFSLIPIFGTILSSVPIVLISMADGFQKGVAILLWIIGIHALEAYFLNPKIMGSAARIHPVIVAFSLIAGEKMFGLVGALFAVPVASIVVACFDYARLKAQPKPGEVQLEPPK